MVATLREGSFAKIAKIHKEQKRDSLCLSEQVFAGGERSGRPSTAKCGCVLVADDFGVGAGG